MSLIRGEIPRFCREAAKVRQIRESLGIDIGL